MGIEKVEKALLAKKNAETKTVYTYKETYEDMIERAKAIDAMYEKIGAVHKDGETCSEAVLRIMEKAKGLE